uniref:PH domain-containing protein n=1 Tax=Aplanochytrium stocchinoi TaxID=215587 RepID=A0A7S3LPG8_9STRA
MAAARSRTSLSRSEEVKIERAARPTTSLKNMTNTLKRKTSANNLPTSNPRGLNVKSLTEGRDIPPLPGKGGVKSLADKGYNLHEHGYYYAAKCMCKLVKPSNKAIQIAGGFIVSKTGELKVRKEANASGSGASKPRRRYCVLRSGMMRFYNTSVKGNSLMDDEPDEEFLYSKETIYVQHIRAVRIKSLKSKSFQIVMWKKPSKLKTYSRSPSMMLNLTLRRNNSDGDGGKPKLQKRTMSMRLMQGLTLGRSSANSNSNRESASTLSSRSSNLSGRFSLNVKSNRSSWNADKKSSVGSAESSIGGDSVVEEWDSDDDNESIVSTATSAASDHKEETITFRFSSSEEMKTWVKYLLIEMENQAIVFNAYADILTNDKQKVFVTGNLRRHSVDLYTLAKGVNNRNVWRMREVLAEFLEENGFMDEAELWYELAHVDRANNKQGQGDPTDRDIMGVGTIHRIPKMEEAFFELTEFLKKNSRHISNADEQARKWFEQFTPAEIAIKLHRQYKKVPKDWEFYLTNSKSNALEILQLETENLKEELGRNKLINDIEDYI